MLKLVWTNCVCANDCFCYFTVCLSEHWIKSMRCCQIQHNFRCSEDLWQLGKEYLNSLACKFYTFFLDEIGKFLTYHVSFYH